MLSACGGYGSACMSVMCIYTHSYIHACVRNPITFGIEAISQYIQSCFHT